MRLVKFERKDEINSDYYKLLQQDLMRPELFPNVKSYVMQRFRWLDDVYFYQGTLEDGRKYLEFYAKWADYKPEAVDSEGKLIPTEG